MMKRLAIWALLFALIASTPADALFRRCPVLCGNAFSWVLSGAAVDLNFATGQYYASGATTPGAQLSIARSTVGYAQNASTGIWTLFGNNTFRIGPGNGLLIEEARTNDAFWARDMTQAGSWTAVGMGTALNAVGIDGNANSATTLTATGTASSCTASCTILQAITLGSQADTYSVWLKRVTGSGAVNITINNLTGTTACTLTTTAFTRCSVTATLANPVIGIQMTVLNDVIVADFNQMEPGGGPTSPILTTNASASRSADNVTMTGFLQTAAVQTTGFCFVETNLVASSFGNAFITADGTRNNSLFYANQTQVQFRANNVDTGGLATIGASGTVANKVSSVRSWTPSGQSGAANGGTLISDAQAFAPSGTVGLGQGGGLLFLNGYVVRIAYGSSTLTSGQIQTMSNVH
jgi:hypothetical protein